MAGTKEDAEEFARRWAGKGDENQDTQRFWIDLYQNVLGCEDAIGRLRFEAPVRTQASEHKGYIDVWVPSARVVIEQKSRGIALDRPETRQGRKVTPVQQALAYAQGLPLSQQPRYIVACNFAELWVFDRERDALCRKPLFTLGLADLPGNLAAIRFLAGAGEAPEAVAQEVSIEAGKIMGRLHDLVAASFDDPDAPENHHALSVLMTRLMFLMFCEDAGLVPPDAFSDYVRHFAAPDLRRALKDLFVWLDTPDAERDRYAEPWLARLPYMDGGLFRERTEIPPLSDTFRTTLLLEGCQEFDWSGVSPTVFGSIFEGALSHDRRRANGQHFTSPENIHKVIDPLFLDGLRTDFETACAKPVAGGARTRDLRRLHERIGGLTFLDPACGSGNFLTETYLCLRRLENRILFELAQDGQAALDFAGEGTGESLVKVTLANFHGIELEDFAACVARTALWIAEKQADIDTAKVVRRVYDPLPLREYGTIVCGNALRMDWGDAAPAEEVDYIIGNPPFLGAKIMNAEQKADVVGLFGKKVRLVSSLDYVSAWYVKAAELMQVNRQIRAAFVSTNSICQGQQVAPIWGTLKERFCVQINFAHRTFVWDSEASDQAHVHVVVVGFSVCDFKPKLLFEGEARREVEHINGYLVAGPDAFVTAEARPVCEGAPACDYGSLINDGGNYIFKSDELEAFLEKEPEAQRLVRPLVGSEELIKGKKRFVLYLRDASPASLMKMPLVMERVRAVRDQRAASSAEATRKTAETPTRFYFDSTCEDQFLVIPSTSSERRCYVPIAFREPGVVATNAVSIIPSASLYHFGVLTSLIHNAWMRAVAGRLETRYRYAPKVVYNTFVWPKADTKDGACCQLPVEQLVVPDVRERIEACAQAVLDAREEYAPATLADMYDPDNDFLFPNLTAAHRALDAAVEAAYGVAFDGDEEAIVAHLFKLYAEATGNA